jgi:Cu2+-containing amine oxidase
MGISFQKKREPVPWGPENPYGTAWKTKKTTISESGFADLDPFKNRVFKIINEQRTNPCVAVSVAPEAISVS